MPVKPKFTKLNSSKPTKVTKPKATSWENVAGWYDGWVGKKGSHYHRKVALPTTLELLAPKPGEKILDLGAGSSVLAPHVARAGANYVGVELSSSLVRSAKQHHGKVGEFICADVRNLQRLPNVKEKSFDGAVFLLSIQDMDPLEEVVGAAGWALKKGGRIVIFMLHPCFRVPRQSGWGFDAGRKLTYRRVDSYLRPLDVPMKEHVKGQGTTRSFHRPLQDYVMALSNAGLFVDALLELPDQPMNKGEQDNQDIPLFLALRARKV